MMINLSIRYRTFLLAFMPMLLITAILSFYFLRSQLDDINNSISERGKSMAYHLANASEYGMFSGNTANLDNLLQHSLTEEGIVSIAIYDYSGSLFVSARKDLPQNSSNNADQAEIRSFRQPIKLRTTNVSDIDEFESISSTYNNEEILGWINIDISTQQITERRNKIILDAIAIILFGLLASILLSLWMGRSFTKPIIRLTQAVHRVENGILDEVIDTNSSGEIGSLEKGFLSMIEKIRLSQKYLQDRIDETTLGLKNSLNIVEKQNQELTDARTKALEASEAKSRFLANISHEIRTPMNGILGFARLLKKSKLNKEQYEYLDTIEKSSGNLLHLIEDILDLSRVEEGKITIKSKPFNLRDCIEDVIMLMAPAVLEKALDITYFYYTDVPEQINAPYERIRQVLINFIGNAIKFSERGVIVIRVMLDENTDNSIKISVSDQGIGIPDIEKEYIFSPFTQIDDTSTRKYGGSGLGLAISKSITRAMGGKVGVEDNVDEGSTFWFTFPYSVNISHDTYRPDAPLSQVIPVILYDTNPDTRTSIHSDLSNLGLTVTEYTNLSDIYQESKDRSEKTICILSISNEEFSNPDTKTFVEEIAKQPYIKLLLLISSIESSASEKARKCGADACLNKPYRHKDFTDQIRILSTPSSDKGDIKPENQPYNSSENALINTHILFAEDNEINTRLIKTILAKSGALISHANNGKEAVNIFKKNDFDIILMDIQMPELNGIDATRIIRRSGNKGNIIPIIGMTANALPEDIVTYKNEGFNDILIKPIAVDDLIYDIQFWIKQSGNTSNITAARPRKDGLEINQLGINKQLAIDLHKMLIDELPIITNQLQNYFETQDWDSLRESVHKLLGGISYCDVPELKQKTLNFQSSLRKHSDTLVTDFEMLIKEIKKLA